MILLVILRNLSLNNVLRWIDDGMKTHFVISVFNAGAPILEEVDLGPARTRSYGY